MNYIKKFESFQTHDEIHEICRKYNITNYTINEDGSIDVNDDVYLSFKGIKKIPLRFNKVSGNFDCAYNRLTTLEGAPQSVGSFDCSNNKKLKSLDYLSKYIHNEEVYFDNTPVYEIFELLDNESLGMIRNVNDLDVIVDDKINLEMLNALLYDEGKPPVEKVKGYINI